MTPWGRQRPAWGGWLRAPAQEGPDIAMPGSPGGRSPTTRPQHRRQSWMGTLGFEPKGNDYWRIYDDASDRGS